VRCRSAEDGTGSTEIYAAAEDGAVRAFQAIARVDSPVEVEYYRNGGILQTVLRRLVAPAA